nr:VTT domain-containing protein [uncultured Neokomagataea sp.]
MDEPSKGALSWRFVLRLVLSIAAILLCVALLQRLPFVHRLLASAPHWRETPYAMGWFLLLAVPYSALGLPRQALCMGAGLAFGVWDGIGLSSLAYVCGALLAYGWARLLAPAKARHGLRVRLDQRYKTVVRILNRQPFGAVLMLRLMPVGSAVLVSLASGLFEVPVVPFAVATGLGGLPQTVVFALVGGGTQLGHWAQLLLAGALFVLSGVLGVVLLRYGARDDGTAS